MNPQDPGSILQAINQLAGQVSTAIPAPTIPTLNYTAPNVSDLSSQFADFLKRASNDPDIVNYYNQLLQQAQGDTTIAENFLEQDYQTGVRNTIQNLQGSLQQLGLTNTQNQQSQQDSLNKRGIALTQGQNGQLDYAGGGEANTEVGQTQQQYALQQEAQQRSASQGVTGLSQTLQKGITSAGQSLTQTTENLQNQKNTDIMNRANTYQGLYTAQQQASATAASQNQQNQANSTPPMPTGPMEMGQIQGNYKWTGSGWAWN